MKEKIKNNKRKFQDHRGFSFVELIVAIFIFTLVMITMSSTYGKFFVAQKKTRAIQQNAEDARFAMELIAKSLRTSKVISCNGNSDCSAEANIYKIETYDYSQKKCIVYNFNATDNKIESGSKNPELDGNCEFTINPVTTSPMVNNFIDKWFFRVVQSASGTAGIVTIQAKICSIKDCLGTKNDQSTLQTTVSLRNYDEAIGGGGGGGGDTIAPTVSITTPSNGATVSGASVTVSATASDNVGVSGVQFKLDGANLGSEDTTSPYSITWDTTTASNGSHSLTAVARDAAGNTTTSSTVNVTVSNSDTIAPTVSITTPSNGATVSGASVTVSATASDNVGVSGVQFKLDGANLGSEDTTSPYSITWDTTTASNGSHSLTAVARDAAGNTTTSSTVNVTVSNASSATLIGHWKLDDGLGAERIPNGNFGANISGWQKNGVSTLSWQNAVSGDGSTGYMRFNIASNVDYDRFATNNGVIITSANTAYQVSFWYRTSGITGNLQAFSDDGDLGTLGTTTSWASSEITPSTAWTYYSTTITTDAGDYPMFGISKLGSIGSGTFDIDAISVKTTSSSTTTAVDSSGSGNNGTLSNGPAWTAGQIAGALSFDGANDYVYVSNNAVYDVDPGEKRTFAAWFKAGAQTATKYILWNEGGCLGWYVSLNDTGQVKLSFNTGASSCSGYASYDITTNGYNYADNQWHLLAGVIDRPSNKMELFMDGASKGTVTIDNNNPGDGDFLKFGTEWNNASFLAGSIDDVRAYDGALSASEIQALYTVGGGSVPSSIPVSDNFNRANENPLSGGGNWGQGNFGFPLKIVSNEVVHTQAGSNDAGAAYIGGAFSENQYSQAKVTASYDMSVNVRTQAGANSEYSANINGSGAGTMVISKTTDGTWVPLATLTGYTTNVGDVVKFTAVGSNPVTLTIYVNGNFVMSYDDYTNVLRGGRPGLGLWNIGGKFDDWEGGDL